MLRSAGDPECYDVAGDAAVSGARAISTASVPRLPSISDDTDDDTTT